MTDIDRLERLERQLQRVQDWQEISNLQGRYNHLVLGHHWPAILALFAQKTPGVKVEIAESGVFHGLDGVRRVFVEMLGKLYNYIGMCAVHELTTPVIEVARDGKTAKAMWLTWGANTNNHPTNGLIAIWQVLKYNHTFVREDGEWKYLDFRAHLIFRSPFDRGWVREPYIDGSSICGASPAADLQSDEPSSFHDPYDPGRHYAGLPLPPSPY